MQGAVAWPPRTPAPPLAGTAGAGPRHRARRAGTACRPQRSGVVPHPYRGGRGLCPHAPVAGTAERVRLWRVACGHAHALSLHRCGRGSAPCAEARGLATHTGCRAYRPRPEHRPRGHAAVPAGCPRCRHLVAVSRYRRPWRAAAGVCGCASVRRGGQAGHSPQGVAWPVPPGSQPGMPACRLAARLHRALPAPSRHHSPRLW